MVPSEGAVLRKHQVLLRKAEYYTNAVVNKDVTEKNVAVAGVPARKISNSGTLHWNKK